MRLVFPCAVVLTAIGVALWLCWPGQISTFNMWMVEPGVSVERAFWFLGEPEQELREDELRRWQTGQTVISGERYYRWRNLYISTEKGVVKQIYYWEPSF